MTKEARRERRKLPQVPPGLNSVVASFDLRSPTERLRRAWTEKKDVQMTKVHFHLKSSVLAHSPGSTEYFQIAAIVKE